MTAPKPLTREQFEQWKASKTAHEWERFAATLDALFRYRERTRGGVGWVPGNRLGTRMVNADDIASELGIE